MRRTPQVISNRIRKCLQLSPARVEVGYASFRSKELFAQLSHFPWSIDIEGGIRESVAQAVALLFRGQDRVLDAGQLPLFLVAEPFRFRHRRLFSGGNR